MKAGLSRSTMWLAAVFAAAAVFGCAEIETGWDRFRTGSPVRGTGGFGQRDEIVFSPPDIQPATVAGGEKLSCRMGYTLFSPDESKEFVVSEVITLSDPNLRLELSRKTTRKRQGHHVLKIEFAVPPDLPPGLYEIVGVVSAGGLGKQQTGSFRINHPAASYRVSGG